MNLLTLLFTATLALMYTPSCSAQQNDSDYGFISVPMWNNASFSNFTLAPYVHNVSASYAWVFPQRRFDFGAREMACECFDPADNCCMATSTNVAPFCVAANATCCGDTYCIANETCCGGACCPSSTTCIIAHSVPGCCPQNSTCSGFPSCLNSTNPACAGQLSPAAQCCPASVSICGPFSSGGEACYASSPPGNELVAGASTTYLTDYDTLTIAPIGTGTSLTYYFPSLPAPQSVSNVVVTTVWIIDVLSSAIPSSTSPSASSPKPPSPPPSASVAGLCDPSPCSPLSTPDAIHSTPSPTKSALCFDPNAETDGPCPASATAYNYNPAGASTAVSSASASAHRDMLVLRMVVLCVVLWALTLGLSGAMWWYLLSSCMCLQGGRGE